MIQAPILRRLRRFATVDCHGGGCSKLGTTSLKLVVNWVQQAGAPAVGRLLSGADLKEAFEYLLPAGGRARVLPACDCE